ncbi:nitrite reductase, copper-containing, partial [Rhizobium phaseoli]
MTNTLQMTRRTMLTGAAVAGALTPIIVSSAAQANEEVAAAEVLKTAKQVKVDLSTLPREKVELVKPPFVHAHQQKAEGG